MAKVKFNYADIAGVVLKDKTSIKRFIEEVFSMETKGLAKIDYIFCSDPYLLEMNKSYLQHDYYTDIITFDLSELDGPTVGEVYISVDRVKDNALVHGALIETELLRVILHGTLHLCGYKDKKKSEITIMRQKEDYYLRLFAQK